MVLRFYSLEFFFFFCFVFASKTRCPAGAGRGACWGPAHGLLGRGRSVAVSECGCGEAAAAVAAFFLRGVGFKCGFSFGRWGN